MANFTFKYQFNDGQSLEIVPKNIRPFGAEEIIKSFDGPGQSYELHIEAENPIVNGKTEEGLGKIRAKIQLERNPSPYALVPGGWLPLPLALPTKFLVDRNVVAQLKNIKNRAQRVDTATFEWWAQFFKQDTASFNALPFAWESNTRKTPSYDEFCSSMAEGVFELGNAFPSCEIIKFDEKALLTAYQMLSGFIDRSSRECNFIVQASKLVASKVALGNEESILSELVSAAKSSGILPSSLPFVAALSCLYDDHKGGVFSIGRALLKPKASHTLEMAYNAASDIRHIEIAAAGQVCFGETAFHLATCDKALASFWCATAPIGEIDANGAFEINYHLSNVLMPRLSQEGLNQLFECLKNEF